VKVLGVKKLLMILLLFPVAAQAAEITCKRSPDLTGQCRVVRGSLGLTPGLGVTLMSEDGSRSRIVAPPGSNADIVPVVMQNWLFWQSKTGSMKTRITGAFDLCPLPTEVNGAGIKDFGCIAAGSHITVDKSAGPN
jgi:hypothetical protein